VGHIKKHARSSHRVIVSAAQSGSNKNPVRSLVQRNFIAAKTYGITPSKAIYPCFSSKIDAETPKLARNPLKMSKNVQYR
jgi:hypothetical protein